MWRRRERVWQGEGSGILLRDLDSTSKEEICPPQLGSSALPRTLRTPPSTWSLPVANVPQQWVSSSQLAASAQPDPFLVPASWHTLWARVPFPDTCCFQAQNISHSRFVSCAPSFSIRTGLSPQPISLLPSTTAQTPPQRPLHVPALAISDPQNPSNCISPFFSPARAVYYQGAKNPI